MTGRRRGHGEGAIFQRHTKDCPAPVNGERPKHNCKGRWVSEVEADPIGGKRRRKTIYGRTRKEVAMKLQQAQAAKANNALVIGRMSTEKWLRYWLDEICPTRGLKVNTLKSHRSKVENYLIPHLGHIPVDKLQPEHIRHMYAEMTRQGLSEATKSQTHAVLRRALTIAVRERKAPYNVAEMIDRPTQPKTKRAPLSLEDARKVLRAAGDDPRPFLALVMGLRQGEALALRWSDIDLEAGVLHVRRSLAVAPGVGLVFEEPKTLQSKAPLPLLPVVSSRLAVKRAQALQTGAQPDDLVFTHNGGPVHPRRDWQAWTDLLVQAGVAHVPLHAARNTTASLLKALRLPIEDASAILRHASIDMTDHYQADDLGRKRDALLALESALALEE